MSGEKKHKYDIFISYAHSDKEDDWVSKFYEGFRESTSKLQVWFDEGELNVGDPLLDRVWFDKEKLRPGDRWQDKLQEALRESKTFIVIISRETLNSKWMFFELGAAIASNKKIIPVIVDDDVDFAEIPPSLTKFQFLKKGSANEAGKAVALILSEQSGNKPTPTK